MHAEVISRMTVSKAPHLEVTSGGDILPGSFFKFFLAKLRARRTKSPFFETRRTHLRRQITIRRQGTP